MDGGEDFLHLSNFRTVEVEKRKHLSGGEQQILAVARPLMTNPSYYSLTNLQRVWRPWS